MPYIGNQPSESFTSFATQEFSTSATTSYTLDHAVANENEIALFVNNVRQQPGSGKAYTATGTALTLSAATASTDTMYCIFLGRALQTVTPATNSITAAMVGNDLISGKTALGAEPADTDEFLVSDAGTLKRVDYSYIKGGGITEIDQWRITSSYQFSSGATGYVTANWERNDTSGFSKLGTGMSESSGVFTFPSTGFYEVVFHAAVNQYGDEELIMDISVTTNNSSYSPMSNGYIGDGDSINNDGETTMTAIIDVTDVSNVKVKFGFTGGGSDQHLKGSSTVNETYATFKRLADT